GRVAAVRAGKPHHRIDLFLGCAVSLDPDDDCEASVTERSSSGGRWGPLAVGIGLYLALTALLLWIGIRQTGHAFVYAQDDPYIHLSLARTLADHGVWGLRADQFASASSSPLWTLLLAAMWTAGAHAVW